MDGPIMTAALAGRREAAESAYYESRLRAVRGLPGNPFGAALRGVR